MLTITREEETAPQGVPAQVSYEDDAERIQEGSARAEPAQTGVKRKRTREVTPVTLIPMPPDTGHRRRIQPSRRVKSNNSQGGQNRVAKETDLQRT